MQTAIEHVASGARPASENGQFGPQSSPPPRRQGRGLGALLAALLALLLALGGTWIWMGSEGSLATALRWVSARQPLLAEDVSGTLRGGGTARRLAWSQDGLRVEADDAELRWRPSALLGRTLHIERLAARRVQIDDQRPAGEPAAGPPDSLALPLQVRIAALRIGELRWAGPPPRSLHDVSGHFDYDGARHLLALDGARFEGGRYRAHVALSAHAPIRIDAALAGALAAPVPGAPQVLALALQATLRGPLADMQAQAELHGGAPAADVAPPTLPALPPLPPLAGFASLPPVPPRTAPATAPAAEPQAGDAPSAHVSARITPWVAPALPELHARLRALDLGALWAEAPHTLLSGALDLVPLPGGSTPGWALAADLSNRAAGPWDQRRLPLDELLADLSWADGAASVRALKARLAGGTLESTGRWRPAAPPGDAPGRVAASPRWQLDTRIDGIHPARLHTALAALPIDGTATLQGADAAIDFDAALRARAPDGTRAAPAQGTPAEALARELRALRLQAVRARGRWADGLLNLGEVHIRTDDAQLAGSARLQLADLGNLADIGGHADLRFNAPGLSAAIQGELHAARGAGTLRLQLADAARALAWARRLPGATNALPAGQVRGNATLDGRWRGGWRDPEIHARLGVPRLTIAPGASDALPLQAQDIALQLDGTLAQARLELSARLRQGQRALELQLGAEGGRSSPQAPLAASSWRATLNRWQLGLREPALGEGVWQLASRGPVPLRWSPAQGGEFEAGAGELSLQSPAPAAQALLAWEPLRWRAGELTTRGRLSGLPLQWAERTAGAPLRTAGVTGDVVFDGAWDAALGRTLRLSAQLTHARGDLALLATDADTGTTRRVAAGLRQARLSLDSDGPALNLRLLWDSQHAGRIDGQLRTELTAVPDAAGATRWSWPEGAPLQGRVQAHLPQISAWSVLAPPGWRLRGALALDARIEGTRAAPQLSGSATADDVALRSVVDGLQFEGGRLRARLDGLRVLIDELSLRGAGEGGGRLSATGTAELAGGQPQARLDIRLDQLRASARADRQVTVSGQLQTTLAGRALGATGQLRVDRALIVLPDDSRPALGDDVIVRGPGGKIMYGQQAPGAVAPPTSAAGRQAAAAQAAPADAPLNARIDIQIELGREFRVRGMGIDTLLAGTLTLGADGPLGQPPQLSGLVQTQGGRFQAYGQSLEIARGRIRFTGAPDNPQLDIVALRPHVGSDQRVGVQVAGTALLPRVRLYAEPSLPDNQTLAWLLLGRPAPADGAEAALLQSAALALLGGREGRGLAARFGLDELSFSGGNGNVANASVTLGKRLSERLYAAYEHSLAGASGTLLIFYELSRRWSLRGQAGENSALDVIFRLSFD